MARFLTSKVFSEIQAETIGWKYGSVYVSSERDLGCEEGRDTYIQRST